MNESNKAIADIIPLPACIYSTEQKSILYANEQYHALTGYRQHKELPEWFKSIIAQLHLPNSNSKQSFSLNANITNEADNTVLPVTVNAGLLKNQSSDYILPTFTVWPAGKTSNISAKSANKHNLAKEFDDFVYAASHDLQEPLRKITTFSGKLASTLGKSIPQESVLYFDRLKAAANNMRDLISSLLQLSRVNTNKEAYKNTSLHAVALQVLKTLEVQIQQKKAQVTINELPVIEASTTQMEELFTNLFSNAIKFSRNNVVPEITISSYQLNQQQKEQHNLVKHKNYYQILVTDNGIGFEQQYAETIFQAFTRLNGKSEYEGFGMGLAVCKKIVEKHNGIITAEGLSEDADNINAGSIFRLILPENQL